MCCELCGAEFCAVKEKNALCAAEFCAVLWAALLVMRGASRCKIATALETATPLTYLEEQRELYLSFSWHILETNFSSTQKSTLERRDIGANSNEKLNLTQLPCVALSWSPCSLYFHVIISEYGYNYKLKMVIAYPSRVVFQKPGSSLEAWLAIQNVRPQLYSREIYLELWEHWSVCIHRELIYLHPHAICEEIDIFVIHI